MNESPESSANEIDRLRKQLLSKGDAAAVDRAAELLAQIGEPAVGSLLMTLEHLGRKVISPIAKVFCKFPSSRAVLPLLKCVPTSSLSQYISQEERDREDQGAAAACKAIISMGPVAVAPLLAAASQTSNDNLSIPALECLKQLARAANIQELLTAYVLSSKMDVGVRSQALLLLVECCGQKALNVLNTAICDNSQHLRRVAIRACASLHAPETETLLLSALIDEDPEIRRHVVQALAAHNTSKAMAAVNEAATDPSPKVRTTAITLLAAHPGANAKRALIAAVQDADAEVRLSAFNELRRYRDPEVLQVAIRCLSDNVLVARPELWELLSHFADESALPESILNEIVNAIAARDLQHAFVNEFLLHLHTQHLLSTESIDVIVAAKTSCLDSDNVKSRISALRLLSQIAPDLTCLSRALHDAKATVRITAVQLLSDICQDRVCGEELTALASALLDPVQQVRHTVLRSLETLSWQPSSGKERVAFAAAKGDWRAATAEGALAAVPLATLLRDESCDRQNFEHATEALTEVMTNYAAVMSVETLQFVASIPGSRRFVVVEYNHPCLDDEEEEYECTIPKQLARQELSRRGIAS